MFVFFYRRKGFFKSIFHLFCCTAYEYFFFFHMLSMIFHVFYGDRVSCFLAWGFNCNIHFILFCIQFWYCIVLLISLLYDCIGTLYLKVVFLLCSLLFLLIVFLLFCFYTHSRLRSVWRSFFHFYICIVQIFNYV